MISASNRGVQLTAPMSHYWMLWGLEETYGVALLGAAADASSGDLKPLLKP